MSLRLKLICHASTAEMRQAAFPTDAPIDALAIKRLAAIKFVPGTRSRVLTSPALRARQTAAALTLDAKVEPALHDLDNGRWVGRTLIDVQDAEPDAFAAWLADPQSAPHGGETIGALVDRVTAWMEGLGDDPGPLIAVTHAAVIKAAVVGAIAGTLDAFWRVDVAPLSIVSLTRNGGRWRLTELRALSTEGAPDA